MSREAASRRFGASPDTAKAMNGTSYHGRAGEGPSSVEQELVFRDGLERFLGFMETLPRQEERTALLLRTVIANPIQYATYLRILDVAPERLQELDTQLKESLGIAEG